MFEQYRIAAILPLLYGKSFLSDAIQSVIDIVDEVRVIYSPVPCHGAHIKSIPNPDSRDELFHSALRAGAGKTCWHEGTIYQTEAHQFNAGLNHAALCPIYIKLDCDEIWQPGLLQSAIAFGLEKQVREVRVTMRHYWRSLTRAICHDPCTPGRVFFRPERFGFNGSDVLSSRDNAYRVHHYGYAQPADVVKYKMSIHYHAPEFRKDCDWFNDIFLTNRQVDCHPCGQVEWTAEDVPAQGLLRHHPFVGMEVIE